jgi:hypothetical protein
MNRKVQIYIQTDTIDENNCACLIIHWDELVYSVYANSTDGDGFNIYTFTIDDTDYEIRKGTYEGNEAWVINIIGVGTLGGTYENTDVNCPVSNQWSIRDFWTESCTVNKEYYERLELFNDEKIILNASVQNISDISKVFSDYSQSFVVPASTINNKILEHWYESDVNPLQDNRIRRKARIEIDHIPFRTGNIQLEKANIKNKKVESYTLQFFGDLVSLKDNLGEASLNTLDLSSYSFEYNLTNVSDLISYDFDQNVAFPLITSKNLWTYADGGTYDINDITKAMYFTELFPAIKVKELFNLIESQYGITFNSNFFGNQRFTKLWLWLKNQEIGLDNTNHPTIAPSIREKVLITDTQQLAGNIIFNADNDTARLVYSSDFNKNQLVFSVISVTSSDEYFIDVYMNGNLFNTITANGTGIKYVKEYNTQTNTYGDWFDETIEFYIRSKFSNTIETEILISYLNYAPVNYIEAINTYSVSFSTFNFDITQYLPDVKITDFLVGILKQFNLTCVPLSETEYQIEPLDSWYKLGQIYDITEYTDTESIDIERVSLYKAINLTHQKSESFINRQFTAGNNREYGDIKQGFVFDGGEFTIDLPFENILFSKLDTDIVTNLTVGYCLNTSYNDYVPKPVLLYNYDLVDTDVEFYITDGTYTNTIESFLPFGQDLKYGSYDLTLNFNQEVSPLLSHNLPSQYIKNVLITSYSMYYESYINNLYSVKNRLVTVKANIPLSILTKLKLNDRLIIKDKRYIINDYQADLTSGDVQFKLLLDFREIETLDLYDDPETIPFPAE